MDFMNTPEQFAHIPKDILRDRRDPGSQGLYSVICTFGPDSPVPTAVAELLGLPVEEIDPIWVRWSPSCGSRRRRKNFSVPWQRCSRNWAVPRTDIRKIPADRQFQRLELPVFIL